MPNRDTSALSTEAEMSETEVNADIVAELAVFEPAAPRLLVAPTTRLSAKNQRPEMSQMLQRLLLPSRSAILPGYRFQKHELMSHLVLSYYP